jgi:hypothetical protein
MERYSTTLTAFLILLSSPVMAGKYMNMCTDPDGKVTFTTQGCATDEMKERMHVEDAQAAITELPPTSAGSSSTSRSSSSSGVVTSPWGARQARKNASVKSGSSKNTRKKTQRVRRCNKR